jgi:hypothetical protein
MSVELRKAAVMLAGLSEVDRSWVLERLPEGSRGELAELIAEVQSLGFASNAKAVFDEAGLSAIGSVSTETASSSVVSRIDACSISVLMTWAKEEPDWVIAQVLRQRKWKWSEAFLEQLGIERKEHVTGLCAKLIPLPARIAHQLLVRVAENLQMRGERLSYLSNAFGTSSVQRVLPDRISRESKIGKWLRSFIHRV